MDPTEDNLKDGMQYGFEIMCIIHETIDAMVHFLFIQSCIKNYINVDILTKPYYMFVEGRDRTLESRGSTKHYLK